MPRGGYRKPAKPAPVSGPGAHSARTDGGVTKMALPNAEYGEAADFEQIQSGAAMNREGGGLSAPPANPQPRQVTPLSAPSEWGDVPVTDGIDSGDGRGSNALNLPLGTEGQQDARFFAQIMPVLIDIASRDDISPSFKRAIRRLMADS